jgi:hypothetical protein
MNSLVVVVVVVGAKKRKYKNKINFFIQNHLRFMTILASSVIHLLVVVVVGAEFF